jgi:hypothetical protein
MPEKTQEQGATGRGQFISCQVYEGGIEVTAILKLSNK